MMKRFFWYGLASGKRLRTPASGYERRNVAMSLTESRTVSSTPLDIKAAYAHRQKLQSRKQHTRRLAGNKQDVSRLMGALTDIDIGQHPGQTAFVTV